MNSKIVVITGAMGSGKSAYLLNRLSSSKCKYQCKEIEIFKPQLDTRNKGIIKSRNGFYAKAKEINSFKDVTNAIKENKKCMEVYIDEVQFIDTDGIVEFYKICKTRGINVFISGLDLTSELNPFNNMATVMCYADRVIRVSGLCKCGEKTRLTIYDGEKDNEIEIGDKQYKGVCEKCFLLDNFLNE